VDPAYRVALVAFPGIRAFDVSVITEVWGTDRTDRGAPAFDLRRVATDNASVPMRGGLALAPDRTLTWLSRADLILVPGLDDHLTPAPAPVLDALRRAHARGTTLAALCGGAFTLAQAGLLDGRRAITHWGLIDLLRTHHPRVSVVPDALFIEDDNIWTAAGTAAGIDLCLHLVRLDHGAEVANAVARRMVVPPHRDGGQAQFVEAPMAAQIDGDDPFTATLDWAVEHLDQPLSVELLAQKAAMSPRTFARRFRAVSGATPHQWLLKQRVVLAMRLLETTDQPVERIASRCGFGSAAVLRTHFQRHVGTSPAGYRRTFCGDRASVEAAS
jgi:transcriptional regulator GlxA family with amidase domain